MGLFRGATIYLGANIVNAAIPFLLLPVLTRILTPAEYGIVAMFITLVSVFNAFTGLSVYSAVSVRYFQLTREELAEYISSCLGILVVSTAALLLIIIAGSQWIVHFTGIPADWLYVAVIIAAMQFVVNLILSLWQVSEKPWHYGGAQVGRSFLETLLSLLFVLAVGMSWQGRLLGYSAATFIVGMLAIYWLHNYDFIRRPLTWVKHTQDALKFGLPLIPHHIGGLLIVSADRLIINSLLGSEKVGVYMVALQISQVIGLLTDSFNRAYAPWLFKQLVEPNDHAKLSIVRGTYIYFVAIASLSSVYGLLAPHFLGFVVGSQFVASASLVTPIALGLAFGGCYYMVVNYIFYTGKTQLLAVISLGVGVLNIPITYFLAREWSLFGAAIAFLVSNISLFTGAWYLSSKVYKMPWRGWIRRQ